MYKIRWMNMDHLDVKIIGSLMEDARMTWAELASKVGLSAPAAADRVNRLVKKGLIKKFGILMDPERAGLYCTAFIAVSLENPAHREQFLEKVIGLSVVQECHHVAGDYDYLLKVRCRNTKALDHIVSFELKSMPGIVRTRTTIVLDTLKETEEIPLLPELLNSKERDDV